VEGFAARGIEVLLLTDPVDSFWVRTALGYEGKPFKSVTQGAADLDLIPLPQAVEQAVKDDAALGTLMAVIKQTLGDAVKEVRKSARLTDSPVCLVADASGLDRTLERLLSRQGDNTVKVSPPVLEINASHPLITALAAQAKTAGVGSGMEEAARLLLDQAHILEGEPVADPAGFAKRLSAVMTAAYRAKE
jgi:molecular chaperone HtpG